MTYENRLSVLGACLLSTLLTRQAVQAQSAAAKPPAYYVSEFEVADPEAMRPYSATVESTFQPFGGRYAVRGGQVTSLEGQPTRRIIMIVFPSLEQARAWYDSPAYGAIRPIRHRAAPSKVFIVQGLPG